MTIKTVKTVVERFIRQNACEVLALKGAWGVGKTYAWQQLIQDLRSEIQPTTYSYVSLFGIASLADLRVAILANARPAETLGQPITADALNRNWFRYGTSSLSTWLNRLSQVEGRSALKGVSIAFDAIAPSLVRNMLICFDDLERLNASRIPHDQLLGFISNLKETAGCKIAIIFNDALLPQQSSDYDTYREKVVDIELKFDPTADEAIEWGLSADLPFRDKVKSSVIALEIKNVRVLRKISRIIALLSSRLSNLHEAVAGMVVNSVVLLGWAYFDKSGDAPGVGFLRSWNHVAATSREKRDKEPKPPVQEVRWAALLKNYRGFTLWDDIDTAIQKVIEHGYVEESGFDSEATKQDALARSGDLQSRFAAAWGLFHNSFDNNEDEVVNAMDVSFRNVAAFLSPGNLNGMVVLLRELGRGALADALIEYYVKTRQGEEGVFDLDDSTWGSNVTDQTIRDTFAAQIAHTSKNVTLRKAVETISGNAWSPEHQAALVAATDDDLYHLFKDELSVSYNTAIAACLRFNQPPVQHVAERTIAALRRIASESRINAARVRRYGISIRLPVGSADAQPDTPGSGE
ncbi:MAG TPA: P-loop NTPase fold protein [Steroidobacteraceae bacterium]